MKYRKTRCRPPARVDESRLPSLIQLSKLPPSEIRQRIDKLERELARHIERQPIYDELLESHLREAGENESRFFEQNEHLRTKIKEIYVADIAEQSKSFWLKPSVEKLRLINCQRFYSDSGSEAGVRPGEFLDLRCAYVSSARLVQDVIDLARTVLDGKVALNKAVGCAEFSGRHFGPELTIDANKRIFSLYAQMTDLVEIERPKKPTCLLGDRAIKTRNAIIVRLREGLALSEKIWLESANKKTATLKIDRILARSRRKEAQRMRTLLESQFQISEACPYCNTDLGEDAEIDHIYPLSRGGLSTIENTVIVCRNCNNSKSNKTLRAFIAARGLERSVIETLLEKLGKAF